VKHEVLTLFDSQITASSLLLHKDIAI